MKWTEEEEKKFKEQLRKHPEKTYKEIIDDLDSERTKKSVAHKNARNWGIERDVDMANYTPVKTGSDNSNWKGGKTYHSSGYVMVYKPNHHRATSNNYVFEHILVAEKELGRKLKDNEVVHHKNGIKDDNRPENLEVVTKETHNVVCSKGFDIPPKEDWLRGRVKQSTNDLAIRKRITDKVPDEFYFKIEDDKLIILLDN